MFEKLRQQRKMARAQKRLRELGLVMDTIDNAFVQKKVTAEARNDFWLRFVNDQDFRAKFIQDMARQNA